MNDDATKTAQRSAGRAVRRWCIEVTDGASKGLRVDVESGVVRIGSGPSNDLVIDDPKVSRHHLEIELLSDAVRVKDMGSKNGVFHHGSRISVADLPISGAALRLGESEITLTPNDPPSSLAPSTKERCARLRGRSESMRMLFARIERIAPTTATVLVHGETGTGKELVADALHQLSGRSVGPFVVVDCAAIPRDLIESELFGHVRGAFTGAMGDRRGAFEQAAGGTIFLDEIGELHLDLQPKLLRVLETAAVRPIGGERWIDVDVRVVAATHRNLTQAVADGGFRQDLFYRLSVVHIEVPALRAHMDDLPDLAEHFLHELGAPPLGPAALATLMAYHWPGNVRQLRNVLERAAALAGGGPLSIEAKDLELESSVLSPTELLSMPYRQAKEEVVARFTREYLESLLARHDGNVSAAARESGIDRKWIAALARRLGVRVNS